LIDPDFTMDWLCNSEDGRACLAEEIRNRTKRGSTVLNDVMRGTKRGTVKTFNQVISGDEADDLGDDVGQAQDAPEAPAGPWGRPESF
jgi:hypothetical protein